MAGLEEKTSRSGGAGYEPSITGILPASAAILAGGIGRRLGGRAKEEILGPEGPLGPALAARLLGLFPEVLVLSRNPALYAELAERAGTTESGLSRLRVMEDDPPGKGPLAGLNAALRGASHPWLYLAACDMPNFSPSFARRLIGAGLEGGLGSEAAEAVLTRFGPHIEPFHALYSTALIPALAELLGSHGQHPSFLDLLKERKALYLEEAETRLFSPDWSLFFNINRPEDLAAFLGGHAARDSAR